MENTTVSNRTTGFGLALAVVCVINALLVVAKEKSAAVMDGMKKLTGHHWITHSVIVIVLFVGLGWLLSLGGGSRGRNLSASRLIGTVVSGVAVASLIIVGFYLFAD
jgi:hypothetical protein